MNLTWIVQHLWLPCWMMLNGAECYFIAIRLLIQLNSTLLLSSCRYEQQRWIFLASNCKQCWTNAHAGNINLGNSITFNIVQREGQTWSTTLIQQCHIMIFRDVKFVWLPYITQHRTTKFYSTVLVDVESVCQTP